MPQLVSNPFRVGGPVANVGLQSRDFEDFLALNGQDCLWVRKDLKNSTHDPYGRQGIDNRSINTNSTDWPQKSDWRTIKCKRLSDKLYKSPIKLYSCKSPETLVQPDILRSNTDTPNITIQARSLLTEQHNEVLTASKDGELDLPKYQGLLSEFRLKSANGQDIDIIGYQGQKLYAAVKKDQPCQLQYRSYPPIKLSILSQNLERKAPWVLGEGGDASLSFPDWLPLANEDEIIALSSTTIVRHKLLAQGKQTLALPDQYIERIIDIDGTSEPILLNNNQLYWPENAPAANQTLVVSYRAYQRYSIIGQLPSPRTQEDQAHPRRAALQRIVRN